MKSAVVFGGCGFIGLYYADKALDLNLFDKLYLVDLKEPEDIFCKSKFKKLLSSGKDMSFKPSWANPHIVSERWIIPFTSFIDSLMGLPICRVIS